MIPRAPLVETRPALDATVLESKGRAAALVVQIGRDFKKARKICLTKDFALLCVSGVAIGYNFFAVLYVVILIALSFGEEHTPYEHLTRIPVVTASRLFVAFGLSQAIGCPIWGLLGGKFPTKYTAAMSLILTALASFWLAQAKSLSALFIGMVFSGFASGGGWVLFPTLVVKYFPSCGSLLGLVMGLGYTSIGLGGTLGPLVTTLITVNPSLGGGSYSLGLGVCALLCCVGAIACGFGLPERNGTAAQSATNNNETTGEDETPEAEEGEDGEYEEAHSQPDLAPRAHS